MKVKSSLSWSNRVLEMPEIWKESCRSVCATGNRSRSTGLPKAPRAQMMPKRGPDAEHGPARLGFVLQYFIMDVPTVRDIMAAS